MSSIQQEKLSQAVEIMQELDIDAWLTFVRETTHNADPALPLILGFDVTWQSAFLVGKDGQKIAVVGRYDVENIERMQAYDRVISYDASIKEGLLEALASVNPQTVAVNHSESDSSADGLSHGMFLRLKKYLSETPYQLQSAELLLRALRGRKSTTEIERIRAAVDLTGEIIAAVTNFLRPGLTEKQIADFIHAEMRKYDVIPAWEAQYCPIVNCGPESPIGHTGPSETFVAQPGQLIHIDLGVTLNEYVSDIQRVWYLQPEGETEVPASIMEGFAAVVGAIEAAAASLRPGVQGFEIDQIARDFVTSKGYPEYQHALGHHVGRTVHDGGTLLGPRWDRYGNTPYGEVEAGNIYTLELGVTVPEHGHVSLEEDVLVTDDGLEWLMPPQKAPIIVKV
jgi:Xaa-Pro aminopeptidase